MSKYFTVYETTNTINQKKYIGMHSTYNLNDNYLGSGKLIRRAILKYGKINFKKEILFIFNNFDEMALKEKEIITESIINDDNYYNLKTGGHGGKLTPDIIEKIRLKNLGRVVSKEAIQKGLNTRKNNDTWYKSGTKHHFYNKTHTNDVCIKMSKSLRNYYSNNCIWNKGLSGHESIEERKKYGRDTNGAKNPAHGSKWLGNNDIGVKCYIKQSDIILENKLKKLGWIEKPKNFNSLKSVTKTITEYLND